MKTLNIITTIAITTVLSPFVSAKALKVGVTAGPHVDVLEFVQKNAKNDGFEFKIIEFNDYILPNVALAEGDLDANSYQHKPFLDEQVKSRGYKFSTAAKTLLFPIGLYSKKLDCLQKIKPKSRIAIPNDPTNGGRALLLLQDAGLIKLIPGADHTATILDIKENPKKLKILEIEAPQLPRALEDVAAAVINTDWALLSGLNPKDDAIFVETPNSPYANIIVVRKEDENNPEIKKLIQYYHSQETKNFVKKKFGDAVLPAW